MRLFLFLVASFYIASACAQDTSSGLRDGIKEENCSHEARLILNAPSLEEASTRFRSVMKECPKHSSQAMKNFDEYMKFTMSARDISSKERPAMELQGLPGVGFTDAECKELASVRDSEAFQHWDAIRKKMATYDKILLAKRDLRADLQRQSGNFQYTQLGGVLAYKTVLLTDLIQDLMSFVSSNELKNAVRYLQMQKIKTGVKVAGAGNEGELAAIALDIALKKSNPLGKSVVAMKNLAKNSKNLADFTTESNEIVGQYRRYLNDIDSDLVHYGRLRDALANAFEDGEERRRSIDTNCGMRSVQQAKPPVLTSADCSILKNVDASRNLMNTDMPAWLNLSSRCQK